MNTAKVIVARIMDLKELLLDPSKVLITAFIGIVVLMFTVDPLGIFGGEKERVVNGKERTKTSLSTNSDSKYTR